MSTRLLPRHRQNNVRRINSTQLSHVHRLLNLNLRQSHRSARHQSRPTNRNFRNNRISKNQRDVITQLTNISIIIKISPRSNTLHRQNGRLIRIRITTNTQAYLMRIRQRIIIIYPLSSLINNHHSNIHLVHQSSPRINISHYHDLLSTNRHSSIHELRYYSTSQRILRHPLNLYTPRNLHQCLSLTRTITFNTNKYIFRTVSTART